MSQQNSAQLSRNQFKAAFIQKCAELGLDLPQMREAAAALRQHLDKQAGAAMPTPGISPTTEAGNLLSTGVKLHLGALGLGGGLGVLGGVLHSRATDISDEDVENVKRRELLRLYADKIREAKRVA